MIKVKGACLCGSVTYESAAEPEMVAMCHCTDCQKQSGSAFSVNVGVPTDGLLLIGDSLTTYNMKGSSGKPLRRLFCGACGSPLVSQGDAFPGVSFIKAGTLTDSSWVKPTVRVWCDSAQSWGVIDDGMAALAKGS